METGDVALKEWAAIEDALASGRLSVLVRKGGIHEKRGGFEVEHRGFWIFPTGWHQNEHELSPAFRGHLGDTPRFAPDTIPLRVWCAVEDAWRVEDLDALKRLADLQPFTDETLESRFEYRGKPYLHVVLVRAHVLAEPRAIPNTAAYEGCVSWLKLDEPVSAAPAFPALPDAPFAALRREVLARLGDAAASPIPRRDGE
ncbi:DUF1802 family protein [Longimicrobium sp.]|uniref:DUF1802 family protein n=1 Tax=Longimicrobium sp. TaxID=2029185 RepID=UPI002C89652D|nr:DUF1802 family protein [Longimicrobium sp.]HSU12870.1 DUF1802 family protein [Longimicrobium sp.]